MNDYRCNGCNAMSKCSTAVEYGSVVCVINRMQSGQVKSELPQNHEQHRFCPHCGRPIN